MFNRSIFTSILVITIPSFAFMTILKPPNNELSNAFSNITIKEAHLKYPPQTCSNNDVYCDTPNLLLKYGYPVETHTVTNKDGYILTAHRIPYGRLVNSSTTSGKTPKTVVYLAHGAWCSSRDWLMNTVDKALGYMLADQGYDVWLGNARGNSYSRNHIRNISDVQYWNFTFHEMGAVDLPLWIDYILGKTGKKDMYYIGHSMGTTAFFVLMSEHPEYNSKIRTMCALAPVAYYNNTRSFLKPLSVFYDEYEAYTLSLGDGQFLPQVIQDRLIYLGVICDKLQAPIGTCDYLLYSLFGYDPPQSNSTQVPIILGYTPDSISGKVIGHYLQLIKNGRFCQYDYGSSEVNQIAYGMDQPPDYNFKNIQCPVVYFHSDNDLLADTIDVMRSAQKLPNLKENNRVIWPAFTHIDFTYAINSSFYVYNHLIGLMNANKYYINK